MFTPPPTNGVVPSVPFVYLDSAASSQTPESVLAAMDAYYRECRSNVHRGMYAVSEEATKRYEDARAKVAAFINADSDEVVFTRGTTESLNLLARSLGGLLGPGDEVLLSAMEHHANLIPWQQIAKQRGYSLKFIPLDSEGLLDMAAAEKLITPRTKIVSVIHASNALGSIVPVKELFALAKKVGATTVLDAAQSVGHILVDVRDIDCDFMAAGAHKMYGPTGIGLLYGKRQRLETLEPMLFGGDMVIEVKRDDATFTDVPWRFEAGTQNIAGAIGFGAACDFITGIGLDNIRAHERELAGYAIEQLLATGVIVHGTKNVDKRVGAISFTLPGVHVHDMATILAREGVCIRGGHHCVMPLMRDMGLPGTSRASLGMYSTKEEIDALIRAVTKAKQIFS